MGGDFEIQDNNQLTLGDESGLKIAAGFKRKRKKVIAAFGVFLIIVIIVAFIWQSLQPANSQTVIITIKNGDSVSDIIDQLVEKKVFSNAPIIKMYLKLTNKKLALQIGEHQIKPRLANIDAVFELFTKESDNTRNISFFPGATINFRHSETDTVPSHREVLRNAGYDDEMIDRAFESYRSHQLFKMMPDAKNLEGLIFADQFNVYKHDTAEQILKYSFDEFVQKIKDNNLEAAFEKQGLTLYQGIILASIVEREVYKSEDRPIVAQVFLKRWYSGQNLGSDVTYQYACRRIGVENNLYINSPYNTRQNKGLPPTPIASPSLESLLAVANPAKTNYLYFVAGDDEKTYFAENYEQHSQNVSNYCIKKCAVH
ncbi:MAG: endolytic transglycosylase MltG [Candidatus Saccharibacteria bacterium]|nr:endolytic transglycosylase MltG [Candidatus Saccharibacteria bacterium]